MSRLPRALRRVTALAIGVTPACGHGSVEGDTATSQSTSTSSGESTDASTGGSTGETTESSTGEESETGQDTDMGVPDDCMDAPDGEPDRIEWELMVDLGDDNEGVTAIVETTGGPVVAGESDKEVFAAMYTPDGDEVWTWAGMPGPNPRVVTVAATSDDGVVLGGGFGDLVDARGWAAKLDAAGSLEWLEVISSPTAESEADVGDLIVLPGGTILLAGESYEFEGDVRPWVLSLGANGDVGAPIWTGELGKRRFDTLTLRADGGLLCSLTEHLQQPGDNQTIMALDAGGAEQWTRVVNIDTYDLVPSIAPQADGSFVWAMPHFTMDLNTEPDSLLNKSDAQGDPEWSNDESLCGADVARIVNGPGGSLVMLQETWLTFQNFKSRTHFLRGYSAAGEQLWIDEASIIGTRHALNITDGSDGTAYLGGIAFVDGQQNYYLARVDVNP